MKKALVTALVLGLSATGASAQQHLLGSDTIAEVTRGVIGSPLCTGASSLIYDGTGSGNGANAMIAGTQTIAPMSRFLKPPPNAECNGTTGQGCKIGLDGIGLFGSSAASNASCTSLVNSRGTLLNWRDVLRLLYAGQTPYSGTLPAACDAITIPSAQPSALAADLPARCGSTARLNLIASWANLFQDGTCSNSACTTGLKHAFRRDDASGTTDTFLSLLGLPTTTTGSPAVPQRTFCNGLENEDLDPIRITCDPNEQVCANIPFASRASDGNGGNPTGHATDGGASATADMGLVLPISLPTDQTKQYDNRFCTSIALGGTFKLAPMPAALSLEAQRCPDGNARSAGKCRWPVHFQDGKFNCIARTRNRPGGITFPNFDGRAYNLIPRDPATGTILQNNLSGTRDPRWGGGGHYRVHQTLAIGGGTPCTANTATEQIGCLVQANPCSIGYAGLEADGLPGNKSYKLHTPDGTTDEQPNATTIQRLNSTSCTTLGARYPLSRFLFLSARGGFGSPYATTSDHTSIAGAQGALADCMCNRSVTDKYINQFGFIRLTSTDCDATPTAADCLNRSILTCQ